MPSVLKKIFFFVLFLALFILVILFVEPPSSWQEASIFQIVAFFLPLILAVTSLIDILMHYFPHSFIISLGLNLLLAFYAVNQLNFLTGALAVLMTALFVRLFPKMKLPRFRLTRNSKIPKLHIQKTQTPKIRRLRRLRHG